MLAWQGWDGGQGKPDVTVDTTRLASLTEPGTTRFGLTTEQRQEVFRKAFVVSHKATVAADRAYPSPGDWEKNMREADRLRAKLEAEIRKTYGITRDQFDKIVGEGVREELAPGVLKCPAYTHAPPTAARSRRRPRRAPTAGTP